MKRRSVEAAAYEEVSRAMSTTYVMWVRPLAVAVRCSEGLS